MPTNAEIHAAIDLLIRQPHSSIVTDSMADLLDDMVDNIDAGGAATPTLYSADGQILTNRIVDLNGKSLAIDQGGQYIVYIDPILNSEVANIGSHNPSGNHAILETNTTDTTAISSMTSDFGGFTKSAEIYLHASAAAGTIQYFADVHEFNGVQEFADNAAAVTGGLSVGTIYRTGDLMKIVH